MTTRNQRIDALANLLDVSPEEIAVEDPKRNEFAVGKQTYLVLTDEEADKATAQYIQESLWAFNVRFVRTHSKALASLDGDSLKTLEKTLGELCESANPIIRAFIDDMPSFIEDAIRCDGRGHFLSSYDGEEREVRTDEGFLFVYHQN